MKMQRKIVIYKYYKQYTYKLNILQKQVSNIVTLNRFVKEVTTMEIFIIVLIALILGAVIIAIILNYELKKAPTIELVQGKLNDEDTDDQLARTEKYFKVVNK